MRSLGRRPVAARAEAHDDRKAAISLEMAVSAAVRAESSENRTADIRRMGENRTGGISNESEDTMAGERCSIGGEL